MDWLKYRRTATPQEVAVVAAILQSSGDERATVLLRQFSQQGCVTRTVSGPDLTVRLEWTTADLDVDLDRPVTSKPVTVHDVGSGQALTFVVAVGRGIFSALRGEAEGPWPRRWQVDSAELASASEDALSLELAGAPEDEDVAAFLGVDARQVTGVRPRPPATTDEVAELESREGHRLPSGVRDLLDISDGLASGDLAVLGVQDLYVVDKGDDRVWWLVGQHEDGRHFLCGESGVSSVPEPRSDPETLSRVAATYREWVRQVVLGGGR